MADQGSLDVIREALADSGGVELDRVELSLDDGAVVLRGAVSTTEQASLAEMLAEQHAGEVRNLLRVDSGLREDHSDPATVADEARARAADDGLPGELQAQDRPRLEDWSAQTTQQTDVVPQDPGMERLEERSTSDISEALGENVPWDPPTQPHLPPTAAEQRGTQQHGQEAEEVAEPGDAGPEGRKSLPEVSQAELERDARADREG